MKPLLSIFLLLLPLQGAAQELVSVIDGDTLEVSGRRVRLFGIDAPEIKQRCKDIDDNEYNCGEWSKKQLMDILKIKDNNETLLKIDCTYISKDKYARWLSVCFIGNINIGREMVARGAALAYKQYSLTYEADEDEAKSSLKGLWVGEFPMPWDFRH